MREARELGSAHNAGQGGWPTLKYFNKEVRLTPHHPIYSSVSRRRILLTTHPWSKRAASVTQTGVDGAKYVQKQAGPVCEEMKDPANMEAWVREAGMLTAKTEL